MHNNRHVHKGIIGNSANMVDSEMNKTEIEKSKSFNDILGGRKTGLCKNNWLGSIPRIHFKIFIFKPKWSFLRENHKNDKYGEFPDFYEYTLYNA